MRRASTHTKVNLSEQFARFEDRIADSLADCFRPTPVYRAGSRCCVCMTHGQPARPTARSRLPCSAGPASSPIGAGPAIRSARGFGAWRAMLPRWRAGAITACSGSAGRTSATDAAPLRRQHCARREPPGLAQNHNARHS